MKVRCTIAGLSKLLFLMTAVVCLMFLPGTVAAQSGIAAALTGEPVSSEPGPKMDLQQTLSDGAQLNTIAFDGFAMVTGNLEAQSFFPPGKVADYWGFQYLRDNTPNGNGHNTSFLTNCAFSVLYLLNDAQFAQLKTLATNQVEQINLYGYKRFPLMKAFRSQLEGDIPPGSSGLSLAAVKAASADLYELDGQISFDRAVVYATIYKSLTPSQTSALNAMKAGGFDSWTVTPSMESAVRERMKGVSQDVSVALMTYAGDLFSWYAGSLEADVYFCPERQGTYFGSFFVKDAPAIGHEGYKIDEALTASAGRKFLDELANTHLDTLVTGLVDQQRESLYLGTENIVQLRTDISELLRSLITAPVLSEDLKAEVLSKVLAKSRTYGELDGEIVRLYAMTFGQVYQSMTSEQMANLAGMRKTIMSGVYNNVAFDFSVCKTPFLYSAAIENLSVLDPYILNTDYLFERSDDVPGAPTGVTAVPGNSMATVTFTAPVSDGGSPVTYYTVTSNPGGITATGSGSPIELAGLTNGIAYTFTVTASNAVGTGPASIASSSVTPGTLPAAPVPVSPQGSGISTTPAYTFNAVGRAAGYSIFLWDNIAWSGGTTRWYTPTEAGCPGNAGVCAIPQETALAMGGSYAWFVNARNAAGTSPWSPYLAFQVAGVSPVAPVPISPQGSDISTTPSYSFNAVSGASGYSVFLWDNIAWSGGTTRWYTPTEAGCPGNAGVCAIPQETALVAGGSYAWFVNARNVAGTSPWSPYLAFQVAGVSPAAPVPVSPQGGGISTTPSYSFSAVSGASGYSVFLWDNIAWSGGTTRWYTPTEAGCPGNTGVCAIPQETVLTTGGSYAWFVNAQNAAGTSPWSPYLAFQVAGVSPVAPVPVSPQGSDISTTPSYSFNAVSGASGYSVFLWDNIAWSGGTTRWYTPTEAGCPDNAGVCAIPQETALTTGGSYAWFVNAQNAAGTSPWSPYLAFQVGEAPPVAGFTFSPSHVASGQMVSFTSSSTNTPTSWSWTFGDGSTSLLQNPSHVYSSAGTFSVTLKVFNSAGSDSVSHTVTVSPEEITVSFRGNIVLGSPTATSIRAKVFSPDQSGTVYLAYGTAPGVYDRETGATILQAANPLELTLDDLQEDTRYYYRLYFQEAGESSFGTTKEYTFHTARPSGSTFTFTIQADSHLDENSDLELYRRTLANVLADAPDFHIDLGDTFMCDKHSEPLSATSPPAPDQATVNARYVYERNNFGAATHSIPLLLVNGNHEGEWGWYTNGTAQNLAVWTTLARRQYFSNPEPDDFYDGDSVEEPFVGKRASWYSWQWGDALFVVIDPYWNTKAKSGKDGWALTLGERQVRWLEDTLASSTATFKFVFVHNLVGGLDGQMRGGIEAAPFFEWGGQNLDGTTGFVQNRPGWNLPIHQLLVNYGVTAVFHGHDHLYARQELDGVVYQEVPQPSAKNSSNGPNLATAYHYASGTILSSSGHIRVTVSPDGVTAHYVRAWLPKNENAQQKNGQVDDAWTVGLPGALTASFSFAPAAPVVGRPVIFTDMSKGSPTSWFWDFGDGSKSSAQYTTHTYTAAGTYTVALKVGRDGDSDSVTHTVTVSPEEVTSSFDGSVVLGSPTGTSIKANVFAPTQSGTVYLAYGTEPKTYARWTATAPLTAAVPLELVLDDLQEDTQYFYRLYFQSTGEIGFSETEEYSFHTARPPGSTFTFCLQGDSHPERTKNQFHADLYKRTLLTASADKPDFYLTMGDDFSVDTLDPTTVTAAKVLERYTIQRPFLGLIGSSAPLFLVNGNHEQAARYLLDGTPNNVAVWAQNARNTLFSQPAPDGFYTGNLEVVPYIGLLRNYYAWTWGDALFVTIDPYWGSSVCVDAPFGDGSKPTNLWDVTHGEMQYQWLKTTLEQSSAKYKFVFAHHVMGGQRGGIELAGQYEWGGQNKNGSWGFTANRPGWASPIHQLMANNNVTIFFQGHDHIWVRQQLDGVTYQTLSEPADPFYTLYNADAFRSGDKLPNTGYTRVTVAPSGVQVDYVRTYLPADEGPGKTSGAAAFSYSLP